MNGRVYDPNLGRFLSVDPVFEFPTNTQSLNPYSYVLNNPLSMTDPTGYAAAESTNTCSTGSPTSCLKAGLNNVTDKDGKVIGSIYVAKPGQEVQITNSITGQSSVVKAATGNSMVAYMSNGAKTIQGTLDAQTKPTDSAGIGSPQSVSKESTQASTSASHPNLYPGSDVAWNPSMAPAENAPASSTGATVFDDQLSPNYVPPGGNETLAEIAGRVCGETCGMSASEASSESLQQAREKIAHVRLNGIRKWGAKVQQAASLAPAIMHRPGYAASLRAVIAAATEDINGIDPTFGAIYFNMRTPAQAADGYLFQGQPRRTDSGPYISPTKYKYIETYGPGPW